MSRNLIIGMPERIAVFPVSRIKAAARTAPTLHDIMYEICQIFGQNMIDVCSRKRDGDLVLCKRIFSYVAVAISRKKLKRIATFLGARDHSNIVHHRKKAKEFLEVRDPDFLESWERYCSLSKIWRDK